MAFRVLGNRMPTDASRFLVRCNTCSNNTSRAYARAHNGQCKECVTGESAERLFVCPDCGEKRLTAYQRAHRYHCDACTRNVEQTGGVYGY